MAEVLEKELNLRRSIQAAVTYPILVVVAGLLLVIFVVSFVIPQFAVLFTKAGIPMPLPTQILTTIGFSLKHHGLFWIAGFGLGVLGLGWLFKQPFIRRKMDEWILTVPLVGDAVRQTILIRFARTLALLFGSGIPILHALKTAQQVVGNSSLAREVDRVGMAVERGERIASVLSTGRFFYPDAIQMVRVGEESGRLDEMLNKVAEVYELRLGHTLKQATTLLEPLLIVLTGGLVAFIMVSMLLPMFEMVRLLQKGGIR
jgi:type IV pilus assembly protein PilC